jgi:membrane-associated protease RseP (regulator of RpoE activity)
VTDETPTADEPTPGSEPPATPEAAAPPPAAPEGAVTPTAPSEPVTTPAEPEPVAAEAAAAAPPAAEQPTVESVTPPTAAEAPTEGAAPVAAPVAAAAPAKERRSGIFLPTWLAALIAVLFIGGLGFAIGYVSADSEDSSPSVAANTVPNNRQGPFGGQLPNGTLPNGNGNGSSNGSGSGNGSSNGNGEANTQTAFLGVSVNDAANNGGAQITSVRAGSPAANAGLQQGDVVTKIGDTNVSNATQLENAVHSHKPGDDVSVTYTRNGNSATVTVHLGNRSDIARNALPS